LTLGGPRCSAEALARDEPLFATASLVSAWLLVEQPGAWGPDALTGGKIPSPIASELQRRASGVRILLIRRQDRIESRADLLQSSPGVRASTSWYRFLCRTRPTSRRRLRSLGSR
jgi:hypothetical protein